MVFLHQQKSRLRPQHQPVLQPQRQHQAVRQRQPQHQPVPQNQRRNQEPTPTPPEESGVTANLTCINQEKLDTAIDADDIQGILEAMKFTKEGLIPEEEAKKQWDRGSLALADINQRELDSAKEARDIEGILYAMKFANEGFIPKEKAEKQWEQGELALVQINQENLYAAINAGDAEAIKGAMQFAETAPIPADVAQDQIKQAQEALGALASAPPETVPTPELEEVTPATENLSAEIELLKIALEPYIEGLPSECSQHALGISSYLLSIESQMDILRNAVNTLRYWGETPTTDVNRELKENGMAMARDVIEMSLELLRSDMAGLMECLEKARDAGCISTTETSLLQGQIDAVLVPLNTLASIFGI